MDELSAEVMAEKTNEILADFIGESSSDPAILERIKAKLVELYMSTGFGTPWEDIIRVSSGLSDIAEDGIDPTRIVVSFEFEDEEQIPEFMRELDGLQLSGRVIDEPPSAPDFSQN